MFREQNKRGALQALGKTADKTRRARMLEGTWTIMWALVHKNECGVNIGIFQMWGMDKRMRQKGTEEFRLVHIMQVCDLLVRRRVRPEKTGSSFRGLQPLCDPGQAEDDELPQCFGNQQASYGR